MIKASPLSAFDTLRFTILGVLIVTAGAHWPSAYESIQIRKRVLVALSRVSAFKMLVEKNFTDGARLDFGSEGLAQDSSSHIRVDPLSGVITLSLPADIDGGDKTVAFIPVQVLQGRVISLKEKSGQFPLESAPIVWLGTSRHTLSKISFIRENLGTLHSKYAPAKCRYIPLEIERLN
jgi:hypothetical protein